MKNKILYCFFLMGFLIISFSSLVYLYEKKSLVLNFISEKVSYITNTNNNSKNYQNSEQIEKDRYWANKILNGGYILHFRLCRKR